MALNDGLRGVGGGVLGNASAPRQGLGPDDQVDQGAEALRLAASPRFRHEILPIL